MQLMRAMYLPVGMLFLSWVVLGIGVFYSPVIAVIGLVGIFIFSFDTTGRYSDFVFLKRRYFELDRKRQHRLWDHFQSTRCSRNVMSAVSPSARTYYSMLGYRWYHFFPDNFFSGDRRVLSLRFWKSIMKGRSWQSRL